MEIFDTPTGEPTREDLYRMFRNLSNIREVIPRALVKRVYDGSEEDTDGDVKSLEPGQILINTRGEWEAKAAGSRDVRARVLMSTYGSRPHTEEDQKSQNIVEHPMNQFFGFVAMPRVGDMVFVFGIASDNGPYSTEYWVTGTSLSSSINVPPLADKEDVSIVQRSGASIRLNDTFEGGGAITSSSDEGSGVDRGLTGNLSMTGNRIMVLGGTKYLPHGLLSKHGDLRNRFSRLRFNTFENEAGSTYGEAFSNDEDSTFFLPFVDSSFIDKKFLRPPGTTDDIIPLTDNTMLFGHHGGGVVRLDDHNDADGYSRMTLGAAGVSIMVGQDYRPLGLAGDSSAKGDGAGVTSDADVFEIHHKSGAKVIIRENGDVEISPAEGRNVTMKDTEGDGKIYLGEGTDTAVRNNDQTTKVAAFESPSLHIGNLGLPHGHNHEGHIHGVEASQDKTYV